MDNTLRLETPNDFPSFPFKPYSIQLDLMKALYSAIEGRKVAVMESPTGTVRRIQIVVVFNSLFLGKDSKLALRISNMAYT